jgi:TATA-box binding protein (TBP) (component of TFIID and TFIIIB)
MIRRRNEMSKDVGKVVVENQLVRFIPKTPVSQEDVIEILNGQQNGDVVIKIIDSPRATIMVDKEGRITVHGTYKTEVARSVARQFLLRLGMDDKGLQTENGPIQASYTFDCGFHVAEMNTTIGQSKLEFDSRLGGCKIDDKRHNMSMLLFANGACVVTSARHHSMVDIAVRYWRTTLEEHGFVYIARDDHS